MKHLSSKPSRTDMTDRECARIIGSLIGGLAGHAESIETLRNAVRWWADTDELWEQIEKNEAEMRRVGLSPQRTE